MQQQNTIKTNSSHEISALDSNKNSANIAHPEDKHEENSLMSQTFKSGEPQYGAHFNTDSF